MEAARDAVNSNRDSTDPHRDERPFPRANRPIRCVVAVAIDPATEF